MISTIESARQWTRNGSELNELMSFGHVVHSDGNGTVSDDGITASLLYAGELYAGESVYQDLDDNGQCIDDVLHGVPAGWHALQGFTGQYSYNGPVMHQSEFIGGGIERHIRETAGYYVAVAVDGMYVNDGHDDDDDLSIGWAVLHYESGESK